jgi:hypothetical protein
VIAGRCYAKAITIHELLTKECQVCQGKRKGAAKGDMIGFGLDAQALRQPGVIVHDLGVLTSQSQWQRGLTGG